MVKSKSAYSTPSKLGKLDTNIFVIWVDNETGVLARVVGLFSGRGYNIESLAVAEIDHKENLSSKETNKTLDFKDRLIECEKLILPLLQNLMKNEDKEYIYWPNRKAIIQQQIDRLQKITR